MVSTRCSSALHCVSALLALLALRQCFNPYNYFSCRCLLRQTSGRLRHPSACTERPPGCPQVQLRPRGGQLVLGQVVFQPEGVLQIHPFR